MYIQLPQLLMLLLLLLVPLVLQTLQQVLLLLCSYSCLQLLYNCLNRWHTSSTLLLQHCLLQQLQCLSSYAAQLSQLFSCCCIMLCLLPLLLRCSFSSCS
jgi:hypothetical protein